MFEKAREKYKDGEFKILVAKMIDKYKFCKTKNKITFTDFLNISEIAVIEKILKEEKIDNYIFFGGKENADRNILIFFPEKFSMEMIEKNFDKILNIIRIKLPNNINYEHREILSGIMKLGIKREKFGDIIVYENGADIICLSEVSNYLLNGLSNLTRFKKSIISICNIKELKDSKVEFEHIGIIVSSIRLDNFVCEISNCSRGKAEEIIKQGRIFINSINELKASKKININDIITIRGKGKYIFDGIERNTKSGKYLLNLRKYK